MLPYASRSLKRSCCSPLLADGLGSAVSGSHGSRPFSCLLSSSRFPHCLKSMRTPCNPSPRRVPHRKTSFLNYKVALATSKSRSEQLTNRNQKLENVIRILELELPRQYEDDFSWDIYSDDVLFADPVTLMRGKLQYRGMIFTLRILTATAFQPSTAVFILHSIEEVPLDYLTQSQYGPRASLEDKESLGAIRTVWTTKGRTLWGKNFQISGDDVFRINESGRIFSHESAWNESPESVWEAFRPTL